MEILIKSWKKTNKNFIIFTNKIIKIILKKEHSKTLKYN